MTKVLFLVSSLNYGGIENYLLRFLRYSSDKIEPVVLCKHGFSGMLENEYKQTGAKIKTFKLGYFSLLNYIKFYQYLRTNKFHAICDFTGDFAGIPLLIAKITKVPKRIVFYRNSEYQFKLSIFKRYYISIIKLFANKSATKFLANSIVALDNFQPDWKFNPNKYKVIYNGINKPVKEKNSKKQVRKMLDIPANKYVIGHVGNYRKAKNHKFIIRIANELHKRNEDIIVVFIGKGVKEGLIEEISRLGLNKNIIFLGSRNDVYNLLPAIDLFLFPSLNESQPNALLEAIINRIPFVASRINAIKEMLPEYVHSMLREPDDLDGFVDLIEHIKNNGVNYDIDKLVEYCIQEFDLNIRFEEVFQEII